MSLKEAEGIARRRRRRISDRGGFFFAISGNKSYNAIDSSNISSSVGDPLVNYFLFLSFGCLQATFTVCLSASFPIVFLFENLKKLDVCRLSALRFLFRIRLVLLGSFVFGKIVVKGGLVLLQLFRESLSLALLLPTSTVLDISASFEVELLEGHSINIGGSAVRNGHNLGFCKGDLNL